MPTWRKLYTKAIDSLDINDMPDDFTRLLWVMLPLGLDREGRGIFNFSWIRSKIMPLRTDVTLNMVEMAMEWYLKRGMVIGYQANGRNYFYIPTWHTYQGQTDREAESVLPAPVATNSRPTHELVTQRSRTDSDSDTDTDTDTEEEVEAEQPAAAAAELQERPNIYTVYEREIGALTPMIAAALELAETDYQPGWVEKAIMEAVTHNARNWKYCETILKRWKAQGYASNNGKPKRHEKEGKDYVTGEFAEFVNH